MINIYFKYEKLDTEEYKFSYGLSDNNFNINAYSIIPLNILKRELNGFLNDDNYIIDFTYKNSNLKQQFLIYKCSNNSIMFDYCISKKFLIAVLIKPIELRHIKFLCSRLLKNINKVDTYEKTISINKEIKDEEYLDFYVKEDLRESILIGNRTINAVINCYDRSYMNKYSSNAIIVNNSAYLFCIIKNFYEYMIFKYRNNGENTFSMSFTCEKLYMKYKKHNNKNILIYDEQSDYNMLGLDYSKMYKRI